MPPEHGAPSVPWTSSSWTAAAGCTPTTARRNRSSPARCSRHAPCAVAKLPNRLKIMRHDGRCNDELRPIKVTRKFTDTPAGSVLWQQGNTIVLCTASISPELPPWMKDDRPGGWITAEYVMLPASTPQRKPWPKTGHTDSRGTEIQRLIGRTLRAIIDLSKIGPFTLAVDCQVLQADGGTRTAAICGAYVAMVDAIGKLPPKIPLPKSGFATGAPLPARYDDRYYDPSKALVDQLAAVSVGVVDGQIRLDLDYH